MNGEGRRLSDIAVHTPPDDGVNVIPISRPVNINRRESNQPQADETEKDISQHAVEPKSTLHYKRASQRSSSFVKRYPENIIHSLRGTKKIASKRMKNRLSVSFAVLVMVMLLIQFIIPPTSIASYAEKSIMGHVKEGWSEIEQAKQSFEHKQFDNAENEFLGAEKHFNDALSVLRQSGQESAVMPYLVSNNGYSTSLGLLEAAQSVATAGGLSAQLAKDLTAAIQVNASADVKSDDPFNRASGVLQGLLAHNDQHVKLARAIYEALSQANTSLHAYAHEPSQIAQIESSRQKAWAEVPKLYEASITVKDTFENLDAILGQDRNRRYLILFLNNTELRPGGGFLGSFATAILKKGVIDGFSVETNIYKRDETYNKVQHVDSPYPVSTLNPDWLMRDSNWDVTFADSAERIAWFFKQEGGTEVDGVLSIDTTVLQALLNLTGPVTVPNQNMTLDAQNVVSTLQYKSEKEYLNNPEVNALNEPKKAVADAFPYVLKKVFELAQTNPQQVGSILSDMTHQKHLLFTAFFDQGKQLVSKTHLDNPLPDEGDFLMINNGNLGGLKSSLNIRQKVQVQLMPTDHNTIKHTVSITRTHNGTYAWPDGDNHNFTRVVVPKNSSFVESHSDGLEYQIVETTPTIEQYPSYTTYGHWLTTQVGKTQRAEFIYETPIEMRLGKEIYTLHYIKQQGWTSDDLTVQFVNANGWTFDIPNDQYHSEQKENAVFSMPLHKNTARFFSWPQLN